MAAFKRDLLLQSLPSFFKARQGIRSNELRPYLQCYQLLDLAETALYRIGRLPLDGVMVTLQSFQQKRRDQVRGSVVVVHGYMDHFGLYHHLIHALLDAGYDVYGYDLSGHGLSDGDALAVDDFQHYATQLSQFLTTMADQFAGPVHLLGQSTGAAVVMAQQLLFEPDKETRVAKRILLAPLVRPTMWRSIQRKFRWLKYVLRRVPRRYSRNSHDRAFIEFIAEHDPLQHAEIPVSWIGAMLAWGDWIEGYSSVKGHIYMVQGTDDGTVDWRHNMAVLGRVYPDLELSLIEDAKHHLVNETPEYRQQVFQRVLEILEAENVNGQLEAAR